MPSARTVVVGTLFMNQRTFPVLCFFFSVQRCWIVSFSTWITSVRGVAFCASHAIPLAQTRGALGVFLANVLAVLQSRPGVVPGTGKTCHK